MKFSPFIIVLFLYCSQVSGKTTENPDQKGSLLVPQKCSFLCEKIRNVNYKIGIKEAEEISWYIMKYSMERKISPFIVFAIIAVETHFEKTLTFNTNNTVDYGICQINSIWVQEFKRLKKRPLVLKKLNNTEYCIDRMTEILVHLYNRNDDYWWSKYHSRTPSLRRKYQEKVLVHL